MTTEQRSELASLVDFSSNYTDGVHNCAIPGVHVIRAAAPAIPMPVVLNPSLCVIVQGAKQLVLEDEIYTYVPSQFLVVSVDLPATGFVTEASAAEPYLCLQVDIDPQQFADLYAQMPPAPLPDAPCSRGMFVADLDAALADSVLRLARLVRSERDIPALAPMMIREVYYRLLTHPDGHRIAQIAITGSPLQRISCVLQEIKARFTEEHRVEALADLANMSLSSFHAHFKAVTAMSPLQYLKRLRLLEARRLMVAGGADAARAALQVGYESPSQFSREYSRLFGAPPARDAVRLRTVVNVAH